MAECEIHNNIITPSKVQRWTSKMQARPGGGVDRGKQAYVSY